MNTTKTLALSLALLAALAWSGLAAAQAPPFRTEEVHFDKGASSKRIKGTIKGDQIVDYRLNAQKGQSMVIVLESDNRFAYFNVTPPGSEEAIFVGSTSGSRYEGTLPASGDYTVRVYLMRNAARRGETANYTVDFGIPGVAGFDQKLALQGITFHVTCANDSSAPTLKIVPAGLAVDNSPITREVDGRVVLAEVADLNVDGSPELYVYVRSAGSGSYGSLVAYSANRKKSLSEIYLPPIAADPQAGKGYMGHDEFRVVESALVRRFPVYRDGDTNAQPTGGMRQIQYKLAAGEAGWVLRADKVVAY